jgi:ribonuclease P protein subunit POP4
MITNKNLSSHEIVGLTLKIEESPDRTLTTLSGKVVLETKNMISIKTDNGIKHVAKTAAKTIRMQLPSGICFISGSILKGRPEDRVTRL